MTRSNILNSAVTSLSVLFAGCAVGTTGPIIESDAVDAPTTVDDADQAESDWLGDIWVVIAGSEWSCEKAVEMVERADECWPSTDDAVTPFVLVRVTPSEENPIYQFNLRREDGTFFADRDPNGICQNSAGFYELAAFTGWDGELLDLVVDPNPSGFCDLTIPQNGATTPWTLTEHSADLTDGVEGIE